MKRLWPLLIWQALGCALAFGQQSAPAPARVVTAYALTSVPNFGTEHDASAWRLLASNDGRAWDILDVRTNQSVNGARIQIDLTNQTAYRIYRLQVDANAPHTPQGVWLAELELMGPVAGVDKEADLQANITSSQEHPLLGVAVNAFDGDDTTSWISYAPFAGGGCWIQCEYVRQSEQVMTNVSQIGVVIHLMATLTLLMEKAPEILSNLAAPATGTTRELTGYALTSANDIPKRDPADWRLLGSNNGGTTWELVDERQNQIFSSRLHRRVFKLGKPSSFALYRLEITAKVRGEAIQLAELEPLYSDPQANARFSMVVSASGENPPMERADMAFDHDNQSKWLCFTPSITNIWIQWQCLPKVEGLPLINLGQLSRLLNRGKNLDTVPPPGRLARTLTSSSLVSANDVPERDPRDWRLLGSNDNGTNWTTLDVRQNEQFANRFQKRTFTVANSRAYAMYRLQFDSVVAAPADLNLIQLADMEPVYAEDPAKDPFSLVVSAREDNPPREVVENLFDGDPQTKWLGFLAGTNRASWVQWYFARKGKLPVVRADSLPRIQPGFPQLLKLQLEGIVVWADPQMLGFLDESGFQMFQFESPIPAVKPGDRVRLTGRLRFGEEYSLVQEPDLIVLGSLANISKLQSGQDLDRKPPVVAGTVEGKVVAASEGQVYTTLRLAPETGTHGTMVKVLNPHHVPLPVFADLRLRVRGVIEPAADEQGRQYADVIWVAATNDIAVLSPAESVQARPQPPETNELTSIHQIIEACQNQPDTVFHVRVRGVITFVDLGLEYWYLQDGPDAIYVSAELEAGVNPYLKQEGMYVELQGTVGGPNGLRIAPSAFVKTLWRDHMPEPIRPSMDSLVAGNCDGKWVQLDGVVTACEKQRLWLSVRGQELVVWVNETDWQGEARLLGSLVRVSGVCAPLLNNRGQRFGVRLLTPSADWVETVQGRSDNPFELPTVTIGSLLQSNPRGIGLQTPFRKITGVVTYNDSQMLFVQTNSEAVRVYPREETSVVPGDAVEVVGIPALDGLTPKLVQAVIRKTGRMPLPAANPVNLQQWNSEGNESSKDGTWSSVQATLLGLSANESIQILELQQDTVGTPFHAYLPRGPDGLFYLPVGSHVSLEGVFKAKADSVPDFGQVVSSFEMYLNSPVDITVLERPSWWTVRHTFWVVAALGLGLTLVLTWVSLLRRQVRSQTRQLRAEIEERKWMEEQVAKTHQELMTASRRAGMAEVATSVLHNVGNVLNSVNVSGSIIAEKTMNSKISRVNQVAALVREHADDLGQFLANDPKGKQLPDYLAKLGEHLAREQEEILREVGALTGNITHIKEIVARQQSYARSAGVLEMLKPAELLEDALHMNDGAMQRHHIEVIREYAAAPPVLTEKHKVLQILINLLRNAKHACDDSGRADKQVVLRIGHDQGRVKISVMDNGIGIPPENLTRIFNHGFTTREHGHGFGLHSGALAARELGGGLTVFSDGANRGATFTLELPLQPPKAAA
jgi:signal transduction histidine kinase